MGWPSRMPTRSGQSRADQRPGIQVVRPRFAPGAPPGRPPSGPLPQAADRTGIREGQPARLLSVRTAQKCARPSESRASAVPIVGAPFAETGHFGELADGHLVIVTSHAGSGALDRLDVG